MGGSQSTHTYATYLFMDVSRTKRPDTYLLVFELDAWTYQEKTSMYHGNIIVYHVNIIMYQEVPVRAVV